MNKVRSLATVLWSVTLCGAVMTVQAGVGALVEPDDLRLNAGRYGHAAVSLGDHIYALGGSTPDGIDGSVERIDPVAGEVERLPHTVQPRRYHTAVSHDGRIYVLGGILGTELQRGVERFDPDTGDIEVVTELPRPRVRPRAVVHAGKLYVMGGSMGRTTHDAVDIYDFEEDVWSRGADKPTATECGIALIEDRIYAVGGYDGQAGTTAFEVYHIEDDRWEELPSLPVRTSAHSVAAAGGRLYSFGDYHQLNRAMIYEPDTGEWEMLQVLYQDARHQDAVLHNDEIWIIGGNVRSRGSFLPLLHRFPVRHLETADRRSITDADDLTATTPAGRVVTPRRAPAIPDDVHELIDELAGKLADIETLSLRWERRDVHSLMGDLGEARVLLEWAYEAPDRFYVDSAARVVVGEASEGTGRFRSASRKRYYEGDVTELIGRLGLSPDLRALVASDAKASLQSAARAQRWERLPDEERDGRSYAVVRASRSAPFLPARHDPARLYFDRETGLLSRVAEEDAEEEDDPLGDDPVSALLGRTDTAIRAADVLLNEPLDEVVWREVRMKDGDEKVDTALEVFGIRARAACGAPRTPPPDDLIGTSAPDFELTLLDGETFRLSDHAGQVVVIDFWATWCGPCVRALPHMRELAETFADEEFVMVGVSRDRPGSEQQVRRVLEQHEITYPNGIDVANIAREYGVRGIPNVVLIDRNGIVRSRKVGFSAASARALEAEIREKLAETVAEPKDLEKEDEDE